LIDSSGVGGAERHIAQVVQALCKCGVAAEAVLYRNYRENPWLRQLEQAHIPHRVLDGSPMALAKSLARERPAILHTHGYKAGIFGRPAALVRGIPVVSTFHTGQRSSGKLLLYELADEWTSFGSRRISVSEPIRSRLPFSSVLIDNFISVGTDSLPSRLPRRIAFVGRLRPEKGPAMFCELARTSRLPDVEWHVYGDGPVRGDLERRYGDVATFHGVVTDMTGVWLDIGLLVMPSVFEGLPLAALEALAAGVPILASRVGALPDVVIEGKTGWLFESGDVDKAREALADWSALSEPRQAQMRLACRQHAEQRFSEPAQIGKLLEVYRSVGFQAPQPLGAALSSS
jgi:glycosyltransferase involved in cell wall biosynthesis